MRRIIVVQTVAFEQLSTGNLCEADVPCARCISTAIEIRGAKQAICTYYYCRAGQMLWRSIAILFTGSTYSLNCVLKISIYNSVVQP